MNKGQQVYGRQILVSILFAKNIPMIEGPVFA